MSNYLNDRLRKWLSELSTSWNASIEQTALAVGDEEIANRMKKYPGVRAALTSSPFELQQFAGAVRACWVMAHQFDAIRFNRFVESGAAATAAIQQLIGSFPGDDEGAIRRINDFIASAGKLGIATPDDSPDRAGAALLASLILTSLYPKRFVDFRRDRWKRLASAFGYGLPPERATLGEWIVWAGKFASDVSGTDTYTQLWPSSMPQFAEPLWVIAGISWVGTSPASPKTDPIDPDLISFPEGAEKRWLHLIRERNQTLVAKAKAMRLQTDPDLRCEVCGFSFREKYGDLGRNFIEAHHKQPVAQLKRGSKSTINDIALVCPNCHRMLHHGDRTLSIEELRAKIQTATA